MDLLNRRRFVRQGLLFVPALFAILRARGDNIMPGPVMLPAASGGTAQYFYPFAFGESSFTSSQTTVSAYHLGAAILCGTTGTCTKLGAYLDANGQSDGFTICLYTALDVLVGGANMTLDGSTTAKWFDATVNFSVSAATTYSVIRSVQSDAVAEYYNTTQDGLFTTDGYGASCIANVNTDPDAAFCHAVRMYV